MKDLYCKLCGSVVECDDSVVAVTCSKCVQRIIEAPKILQTDKIIRERKNNPKPQGWHWMKRFVDNDGNVFAKGVEQPELKGKYKPTVIEKKNKEPNKLTTRQKHLKIDSLTLEIRELRKDAVGSRDAQDRILASRKIKKLTKELNSLYGQTNKN